MELTQNNKTQDREFQICRLLENATFQISCTFHISNWKLYIANFLHIPNQNPLGSFLNPLHPRILGSTEFQ